MANKSITQMLGIFIGILIILSAVASAFSISAPYMENRKLYLSPGESEELEFVLQNAFATEPTEVGVKIEEGSEIMQIIDPKSTYTIPVSGRASVNTRVTAPPNARIGDIYKVRVSVGTVPAGGGAFTFGSSINHDFEVVVGEKPKTQITGEQSKGEIASNPSLYLIVGIIIVILVIFFALRKRKTKKR